MKTRLHPSIILEKLIASLVFIILIGYGAVLNVIEEAEDATKEIQNILSTTDNNVIILIIGIIIIVLAIFVTIFAFIWKNTYLSIENGNLMIERGKLFKKVTTINLHDIATVNIRRNLLEQILGTAHLKIDLHSNVSETYRGKLVFKYDKALEIRQNILGEAHQEKTTNDFKSLQDYKFIDVIKHILLSIDLISLIVILGVYTIVIYSLTLRTHSLIGLILTIALIIVMVLPLIWSLFKTYLSYYNFKCNRDKDNIQLAYGALTSYRFDLPIQKINAIIIRQSMQARILKYYMIEVVNAGIGGEDKDEKTLISLYVKENEKNNLLNSLLPEYKNKIKLKNQTEESLKHYLSAKLPLMIISIAVSPFTYCLSLLLIPILLLIAYGQYKTQKIGYNKNLVIMTRGIVNKTTVMIKYDNVELIAKHQKVFSKLFNTYNVSLNIVGPKQSFVSGLFDQKIIDNIIKQYK